MIDIAVSASETTTINLSQYGRPEIIARSADPAVLPDVEAFIRYFAGLALESPRGLKVGVDYWYGFWQVRFLKEKRGLVSVAMGSPPDAFDDDVTNAVVCWRRQHEVCASVGAEFDPPTSDSTAIISAGVLDGLKAEGRRFPGTDSASGWFVVTNEYDGRIESTQRTHLYHLAERRPDLVGALALPPGGRFAQSQDASRVWLGEI